MFGWFRAAAECPISQDEKVRIEERFTSLASALGIERLRTVTTILPTTEFFPATYDAAPEEVADLTRRVEKYMGIEAGRVSLHFYSEDDPVTVDADWKKTLDAKRPTDRQMEIWMLEGSVKDPLCFIAVLVLEISYILLIDDLRKEGEQEELLVDAELLSVFLGLGILTANESMEDSYRFGKLSLNAYGYALALYALARGETQPKWASQLRDDVAGAMRQSIRYLRKTSDCSFPHLYVRLA